MLITIVYVPRKNLKIGGMGNPYLQAYALVDTVPKMPSRVSGNLMRARLFQGGRAVEATRQCWQNQSRLSGEGSGERSALL